MPYFTKKGTGKDKGKTCVYKKEDRTKVGCTAGPVKKYLAALHVNESEDLEWMMGSPKVRLGELKGEIYDYVSPGDTIYITGRVFLEEFTFDELSDSLYNEGKFIDLYEEPATVLNMNEIFRNSRLNVKFGENITSIPIWVEILNDDWIDLGAFQTDDDLLITLPNKSINESEDFGWTEDFRWTTDMLYSMLDNCNEIKVSNYSLTTDSPYLMRGEPVIYTLTRCEEWWDKFSQIPLDDNGRGPAEWYQDYDEGRIGLLATYESIHPSVAKYKNLRLVDFEKDGWTITQYPQEIVNSLNGKHTELFILLDDKGKPVYELIPEEHRERVKTNWEDRFFGEELNESEDLDWIRDEGKEREIIIDDLNKFVNELNNRFREKGDTLLELDYDSVEGGYYFGRVWVYNKIYELYQYGDKFKYVVHELIKNQHHPQGEEYQQVYENKDLPMKHFLIILKNGIANDYYRGYMDRVLSESKDFEWTEEISNTPLHNITFKIKRGGGLEDEYYPTIYTIKDDGLRSSVLIQWVDDEGDTRQSSTYMRHTVNAMFRNHIWVPVEGPITESSELSWIDEVPGDFNVGDKFEYLPSTQHRDPYIVEFVGFKPNTVEGGTRGVYVKVVDLGENTDSTWDLGRRIFIPNKHLKDYLMKPNFMNKLRLKKINESDLDWIQKQEPERVMKKSKSYGIDVRHLKSEPPISPLSTGYSDLTKGDILDKLSSLGYDTQHIDVNKATYFYVEPGRCWLLGG
jgi:hypothetical protein